MEVKIIFEDEELLVLDKPSGMIVNRSDTTGGEKTLQDWVEDYLVIPNFDNVMLNSFQHLPKDEILKQVQDDNNKKVQHDNYKEQAKINFIARSGIVHRLDKETSGIILVAKTLDTFRNLQEQFKERKVHKTYIALAHGKIEPEAGEINVSVGRLPWNRKRFGVLSGGRESVTLYKVLSVFSSRLSADGRSVFGSSVLVDRKPANWNLKTENREPITEYLSLVELSPKTGRTHQIRVHLQYIKHPIFADSLYAGRKTGRNDRKLLSRVFLHASKISFSHPARNASQPASQAERGGQGASIAGGPKTNEILTFESSLPKDLNMFLENLKS